ncbi:hypothetical protein I4U23_003895 [Adineta vaga]|nr:hypothetical protein I4U23_003895 [Adineta vaga]
MSIRCLSIWMILMMFQRVSGQTMTTDKTIDTIVPYNRPKLDEFSIWNSNGITHATSSSIGTKPYAIFINTNNTIYAMDFVNNRIQIWSDGSVNPTQTILGNFSNSYSMFVTFNDEIYIDNGKLYGRVDKFILSTNSESPVVSAPNTLYWPIGIFVNINFDLYVADSLNNRIQLFPLAISYAQPKFCHTSTWNPNGTTHATSSIIGTKPYAIFINTNNTIYAIDFVNGRVQIWSNNLTYRIKTLFGNFNYSYSIFVTDNEDIFVDNGAWNYRVDKLITGTNSSISVMSNTSVCYGLFVDTSNTLYCSVANHKVVKRWLNENTIMPTVVAGTDSAGSTSNTLKNPKGIFVNTNFALYVADSSNHRIQLFPLGQSDAITVAGTTSSYPTTALQTPSGIVLDGNNYLFIVDQFNHRIIGEGPNGFRCIIGCSQINGSASNQLSIPYGMVFDTYGNIYVTDRNNNRIQKFILSTNSYEEHTTQLPTSTITTTTTTTEVQNSSNLIISTVSSIVRNQKYSSGILISTANINIICVDESTTQPPTQTLSSSIPSIRVLTDTTMLYSKDSTSLVSKHVLTTTELPPTPSVLVVPSCPGVSQMGLYCNLSSAPCASLQPCENNSTCIDNSGTVGGYNCKCNETSNTTFECVCEAGWRRIHCETKIDYCENITCLNHGVCRSLLMNYTCECLGTSFSGRHCEITSKTMVVRQITSKSFGYISYIGIGIVCMFLIILDILKYCFGIDPVKNELDKIRRIKRLKKNKPPQVIQRFVYVN